MADVGVLLVDPKTPFNVGAVIRACSIFDVRLLRWSGPRIEEAEARRAAGSTAHKDRMPREERMKDYAGVDWKPSVNSERPLQEFAGLEPVCVEFVPGAQLLPTFEHPERAVYIFGPEDGNVPKGLRVNCHHFVRIPAANRTPFNLAASVNLMLYDRFVKTGDWMEASEMLELIA